MNMRETRRSDAFYILIPLLLCFGVRTSHAFSLFSLGSFSATGKCVSVLETNPEIKAHFTDGSPGQKVVLDEQFEDNRNNWPEERTMTPSDAETYTSTFKIHGGKLHLDNEYNSSEPTIPITLDADHDYLIETCFAVDGQYFGLIWGGRSAGYNTTIGDDYSVFNIQTDFGRWGYFFDRDGNVAEKQEAQNPQVQLKKYISLAVAKQGKRVSLFLDGTKVKEVPAYALPGNRIGFDTPTEGKAVAEYLVVREAAPTKVTRQSLYTQLQNGEEFGFFVSNNDLAYDRRTGLSWLRESKDSFEKFYGGSKNTDYATALSWIQRLNDEKWLGISNWRLPSTKEYRGIYVGKTDALGHFFYPFDEIGSRAWTNEDNGGTANRWFSYGDNGFSVENQKTEYGNGYAVAPTLFSLRMILEDPTTATQPLLESQQTLWKKIVKAFHANLSGPGTALFNAMLDKDAERLYNNDLVSAIIDEKLPMQFGSQLLLDVKPKEHTHPVFWYDYARLAIHANQPALALQAIQKLETLADTNPEHKEEILDYAALLTADANMLLDKKDDAYAALLMRDNWNKKLFVTGFINTDGVALLQEKARLITMLGINGDWVAEPGDIPNPEALHNLETGQLIEPVETAPILETPAGAKPAATTTTSPKATVLD